MDNGCGDDSANEDDMEELMKNREAKPDQHVEQISICSLDQVGNGSLRSIEQVDGVKA